jgi:aspartate aminotransferase-like enzyme
VYRPQNLRIPGPTFVPRSVLEASARPMINHRGPEFASLLVGVTRALQDFLRTQGDVFILTCSGSGAMEAAVANTLARGDRVLVFSNGSFGDRFYQICKSYGLDARKIDVTPGRAVDPDLVRDEIAKDRGKDVAKAVLVTHNETSTGVLNPLKEISEVVRESGKLLIVDSISGAGACELEVDEWGIDVLVTASQKAWGAPPGISMITMSQRAWKANLRCDLPRAYFDLQAAKDHLQKGSTPWTPAVSLVIALQEALRLMSEEGLEAIIRRHRDLAYATRRGVQALGLAIYPDEAHASPTVTAFRAPPRMDPRNLIRILRESYDVIIAGGQGKLEGVICRVGHMGFVTLQDMVSFFSALELALRDLHHTVEPGQAIAACLKAYDEATQPPPKAARTVARPASLARR